MTKISLYRAHKIAPTHRTLPINARSQRCGSAGDGFPIATMKNSLTKRAIKVHGTSVCLESFQQLFNIHWRGSAVRIGCWRRGELFLSDLVIGENVCSRSLRKHSYSLCCDYLSWKTFSHSPTEIVLASLVFQRLSSVFMPVCCSLSASFTAICIGGSFAMMETVLLVATILQKFRLSLVPGFSVIPWPSLTLRPKSGIRMVVAKRWNFRVYPFR